MAELEDGFDMGAIDAPENNEKVFIKPGFRKLTVKSFSYKKEDEGKTPLIIMTLAAIDAAGGEAELNEKLYMSGKLNAKGVPSIVVRLQELYRGLTGEPKMTIQTSKYYYDKKETDGTLTKYSIPNPTELCEFLNKKLANKQAIFKVGGEIADDGRIFTKLTYSGFLYFTDKGGNLVRYKEEKDFTDTEYKYAVTKRKGDTSAPVTNGGVVDTSKLDLLG